MTEPTRAHTYTTLFKNKVTGRSLSVTIWMPINESTAYGSRWRCDYVTNLDGNIGVPQQTYGDEWLLTILLAFDRATRVMAEDEANWETADGLPLWLVRPEQVPITWGYEYFAKCRHILREEDKQFQDAIERRRRASEHQDQERSAAEKKMALLMQMNRHIGALTEQILELPDASEQVLLRRPLGDLMALVNDDLMRPIVRAYPDLDPDE